ncbi:hypothetical protein BLOT_000273 [Blomia tropicalis]|nr:hypothetical protein BLOT_000273 [Blomia tropicalis]
MNGTSYCRHQVETHNKRKYSNPYGNVKLDPLEQLKPEKTNTKKIVNRQLTYYGFFGSRTTICDRFNRSFTKISFRK